MVNRVTLVGNLGKDPESRTLDSGRSVCNFTLATHEKWRDKQTGELKEDVQWHKIVAWGPLAELCAKALYKGRLVYIEGQIRNSSYDKDGVTKFSSEIEANSVKFLDKPDRSKQQLDDNKNGQETTPFG